MAVNVVGSFWSRASGPFAAAFVLCAHIPSLCLSPLTFDERVACQISIERVYYNHRAWPKENPGDKPPFDKLVPMATIEAKVRDYLRKCNALDKLWCRPISGDQLQAEMARMAKDTQDPETLRDLFGALGNDPFLTAECLARPTLADRLLRSWYLGAQSDNPQSQAKTEIPPSSNPTFDSWWAGIKGFIPCDSPPTPGVAGTLYLPDVAPSRASDDAGVWSSSSLNNVVDAAYRRTAVWTGSEMIVWGGNGSTTGSRYNPATDTWTPISNTNSPVSRYAHTAIWTGNKMVVWGGAHESWYNTLSSGGRYDPITDSWAPTAEAGACPSPRVDHTAVWTGSKMIVWGGRSIDDEGADHALMTGGVYDPSTDGWEATSEGPGSPSERAWHTAIWTGGEMVVWGGKTSENGEFLSSGGKYAPIAQTWVPMSTASPCPAPRRQHSAIWTGREMIVWGGDGFDDPDTNLRSGGRYVPETDSWSPVSTGPYCPKGRSRHTAIWTGESMIVWGGLFVTDYQAPVVEPLNTGGRYDPHSDSWIPTSIGGACPSPRYLHQAMWTGTEMIVWGGHTLSGPYLNTGGRYDPATESWVATSTGVWAPSARSYCSSVWTGAEIIVWGGLGGRYEQTGGRYMPSLDSWEATSIGDGCPSGRYGHTATWSGTEMIVWGGAWYDYSTSMWRVESTGGRYSPYSDSWLTTSIGVNCPSGRWGASGVWTGTRYIVWGGDEIPGYPSQGGLYDPSVDAWALTSIGENCPSGRYGHIAIWTGSEMIVWGGRASEAERSGGRYDPEADAWTPTPIDVETPSARWDASAVWTGEEIVVWGGNETASYTNSGGRYSPSKDEWKATSIGGSVPSPRHSHSAVWAGDKMIIWGGLGNGDKWYREPLERSGGYYIPSADYWMPTTLEGPCPAGRYGHSAVWTGEKMILWAGYFTATGGAYVPPTPAIPDISLVNVSGAIGESITIPVTLATDGAQICNATEVITFDPISLQFIGVAPGEAATASGKEVTATVTEKDVSILVSGTNATTMPNGIIAYVGFQVRPAPPGAVLLEASCGAVNCEEDTLPTKCTGGSVEILSLPGDCDGNGRVNIGEVQRAVNMFLGSITPDCGVDCDGNGRVSIGELQKVINAFLGLVVSC